MVGMWVKVSGLSERSKVLCVGGVVGREDVVCCVVSGECGEGVLVFEVGREVVVVVVSINARGLLQWTPPALTECAADPRLAIGEAKGSVGWVDVEVVLVVCGVVWGVGGEWLWG